MNMCTLKKLVVLLVCWLFASLPAYVYAQTTTVNLNSAGTLKDVVDITAATNLTITGSIDARDFAFIRDNIPNLAVLDLSGVKIEAYTGDNKSYPADGVPVHAFYNGSTANTKINSITLPFGLTSIGDSAFYQCSGLTNITNINLLPIAINSNVFEGVNMSVCKLTVPTSSCGAYQEAEVWRGFSNITGGGALLSVRVSNIAFGNISGTANGLYVNNTPIHLRATVTSGFNFQGWISGGITISIEPDLTFSLTKDTAIIAFFGNSNSYDITAAGTLKNITGIKNVTHLTLTGNIDARDIAFIRDSIPNIVVLDLSGTAIMEYNGAEGTSAWGSLYPANEMPQYSFYKYNFSTGVYTGKTSLTSVTLPDGLKTVGDYAFSGCSNLNPIDIPSGVTSIGNYAFSGCSNLASIDIPVGVISIGDYAFRECSKLYSATLPTGLASIGNYVFSSCRNLTSINISSGVTSIGNYAFSECNNLISINLPAGVTSIGNYAFYSCSNLRTINLRAGVTSIGDYAFSGCNNLTSINIPAGVTSIGNEAFRYCSNLSSVILPAGVVFIGNSAFAGCNGLISITNMNPQPVVINSNVFEGVEQSKCELKTPASSLSAYQAAAVWKEFSPVAGGGTLFSANVNNIAFGSITGTPNGLYPADTLVSIVAVPAATYSFIEWISEGSSISSDSALSFNLRSDTIITAIFGTSNSHNITAAGTLKNIAGIKNVTHLTLTGIIDARDIAFIRDSIPNIVELNLSGTTIVGYDGTEGTSPGISLPYPANEMPQYSFYKYNPYTGIYTGKSLTSIILPDGLKTVGNNAFRECRNLNSIIIPAGVTSIGDYAFSSCSKLNSATLQTGLVSVGNSAFSYCSSLGSINIPAGVTSIENSAFYWCSNLTLINIPAGVTSIGNSAFYGCGSLTSIDIPAGVTSIGSSAFSYCGSLTSIDIPAGVTSIEDGTFHSCSNLTSVIIPAGMTSIGSSAFSSCYSLTSIDIPAGVTSIGDMAFSSCNDLDSINLPAGVTSIGNEAFSRCYNLTSINIPDGVTSIGNEAFINCSSLTSINIPAGVTSIGYGTFRYCSNLASATLPAGIVYIGNSAFSGCDNLSSLTNMNLQPVVISSNVFEEVNYSKCELIVPANSRSAYQAATVWKEFSSVAGGGTLLSANVNNIAFGSITGTPNGFYPADTLVSIVAVPAATYRFIKWISEDILISSDSALSFPLRDTAIIAVFGNANIYHLPHADTLRYVEGIENSTHLTLTGIIDARDIAFIRDSIPNLVELDLSGTTIVEYNGTEGTSPWGSLSYPANEMPQHSFYKYNSSTGISTGKTSLTSVILPDGLKTVGYNAFAGCSNLTRINIPAGVTSIGNDAFSGCSNLISLNIPAGVTSMGNSAFSGCSKLYTVTLPTGLDSIGNSAFSSCSNLISINIPDGVTSISDGTFSYCRNLTSINLPAGVTYIGNSAFYNCSSLDSINLPAGVTYIGNSAFSNCSSLDSINLPAGVTSIGNSTFSNCSNLRTINLPAGVTSIGNFAFSNCSSLDSINIPAGVTSIENYTFSSCHSLTSINIPAGVTSIGNYAFSYCHSLTSINLPAGVTSIGDYAFSNCDSLTSVNLSVGVISIGNSAFSNCNSLTRINIPAGVISIGNEAFINCRSLISINIPAGITSIGYGTFRHCENLATVILPAGVAYIGNYAFAGCNKLISLTNMNLQPVVINSNVFEGINYSKCELRVPTSSRSAYQSAKVWEEFSRIIGGGLLFSASVNNITFGNINGMLNGLYPLNTPIGLTATPVTGYMFVEWRSADTVVSTNSTLNFSLKNDIVLTAVFGYSSNHELSNAGTLKDIPGIRDKIHLTISGDIDARDIAFMRDSIPNLAGVDLSGATIVEYTGTQGTYPGSNLHYSANKMPGESFTGKTSLTSVILPAGIDSIGNSAFSRCDNLNTVTLPAGVSFIGDSAFYYCPGLNYITNLNPVPISINNSVFVAVDKPNCKLEVLSNSVDAYKTANIWKEFFIIGDDDFEIILIAEHGAASGGGFYNVYDSVILLVAKPDAGYRFVDWSMDGSFVSSDSIFSFSPYLYNITSNTVLFANFRAIAYDIIYELNGGVNHDGNPATYTAEDSITLKSPSKPGYDFAGWDEGDTIALGSTGDKTFTAQWSIITYNISYELNGGVNHADNPATYTVEDSITLESLSKPGYDFAGWAEGNTIVPGSTGDKTFTAQWSIISYIISYELNGGVNHAGNPATYTVEDSVVLKKPGKAGYNFTGWTSSDSVTINSDSTITIVNSIGDRTFTATWEVIIYNIVYELNGGVNHAENPYTCTVDDTIVLKTPTRQGYNFTGWTSNDPVIINSDSTITIINSVSDKTFTATWKAIVYNIVYELNGGLNHADNPLTYTVEDSTIILKQPERNGYNFTGWLGDSLILKGSMGEKNVTAQWTIIVYNISYELNGGTNHVDNPATYTVEDTVFLQNPVKHGYDFAGWKEGDTIDKGSTGDKTFTAQWSIINYKIDYELDGGVNHEANPDSYTVEDSVALNEPGKTGYDFVSWNDNGIIAKGSVGDKTFTAQWSVINYNIVYELDGGTNHPDNPATYTVDDSIVLKTPTKEGFRFTGWVGDSIIVKGSMGDKTFTGQWKCLEANIEEIEIDDITITPETTNDSIFEYTVKKCNDSLVVVDLGTSLHATVTVNGEIFTSKIEVPLKEGTVTPLSIRVQSETGDSTKNYRLNIAAPINDSNLYYHRWNDIAAVNRNPATNGGYDISGVRWYKQDGDFAGDGVFIMITGNASDYYSEIKVVKTNAWHRVCTREETEAVEKARAYPNPVPRGEKINLQLPKPLAGSVLNIYNITGALVKSGLSLSATSNSIDVSEHVSGIYLLQIIDKTGKSHVIKVILE
jgi:uncharacterized repeat protein (TIGR02543 family)